MARKKTANSKRKKKVFKKRPTAWPKIKIAKPARKALKKKAVAKRKVQRKQSPVRESNARIAAVRRRGMEADSGGQAGDIQGLSSVPDASAESVIELLEEGQTFEAELIQGAEDAPDADQGEIRTREVPEDDVPEEYRNADLRNADR